MMHLSALVELETLGDKVRFWKMDRGLGTNASANGGMMNGSDRENNRAVASAAERKALGMVEAPKTHKMALVVASGKTLQKVESEIKKKTLEAKKVVESRSDVSR